MKAKDKRLKILGDLLNGIKSVKLNYWDPIFKDKVTKIREDEVMNFKKYQIFFSISNISFYSMPILLSILSFLFFLYADDSNVLTPELAFTVLNYFTLLKLTLSIIPRCLHFIIIAIVSGKRIHSFLRSKERENYVQRDYDERNAVTIESDVSFSWEDSEKPKLNDYALKNLNIKIKKGDLVALVSKNVASGRSSFISCLLGEMKMINEKDNQKINISKDMQIAFVGSKPWVEKKSIKANILFGLPFDQQKYNYVLDQCLIREELIKYLNADDQIMDQDFSLEIKQKVCLARAFYSDANLILLDDFLSVFNDFSSKIVFDKIVNPNKSSLFKGKTCIMVLNRLDYSKYFDQILTFANGEVTSISDLNKFRNNNEDNSIFNSKKLQNEQQNNKKHPNEIYKRSISTKLYDNNHDNLDLLPIQKNDNHNEKNCQECAKKLIDDEKDATHLGWPVYR